MNQTFGQIFQCPLVNDTVSTFPIPVDPEHPMRILLVSDTHLGATIDFQKAADLYMAELTEVVKAENVTHVCHLGDLVDGTIMDGHVALAGVLKQMAELKLPTYCIGGNHDREFFADLRWEDDPYVVPLQQLALTVEFAGQKLFLAHDLANNYRVRDQFAYSFVSWIKEGCKKAIRPTDWLITGHTHTAFISNASRIGCVGQFSPEIDAHGYTILEVVPGITISTKYLMARPRRV